MGQSESLREEERQPALLAQPLAREYVPQHAAVEVEVPQRAVEPQRVAQPRAEREPTPKPLRIACVKEPVRAHFAQSEWRNEP